MPTQTFQNLTDEKKERIIAGAMKEFSEYSFTEVSISNIVENAGISRGSFYQYFEDKRELYYFLIEKFRCNYRRVLIRNLDEYKGDFYRGYLEFGKESIRSISQSEQSRFFEKLYLDANYRVSRQYIHPVNRTRKKEAMMEKILERVDLTQLRIETKEELASVMRFMHEVLDHAIMEGFWKQLTLQEIQKIFTERIDWIFLGILKTKKMGDE